MQDIGAVKYFETSAKTMEGVKELFACAAKISLKNKTKLHQCIML
jgi:GTPase SAR1 family protein